MTLPDEFRREEYDKAYQLAHAQALQDVTKKIEPRDSRDDSPEEA